MRALSTSQLLEVWESGLLQKPVKRALSLFSAADPEASSDDLAKLSIGQRDARLLSLREWAFGPNLVSLEDCPNCHERLELSFKVAEIRVNHPLEHETIENDIQQLTVDDYEIKFRLPNSLDMQAISDLDDLETVRQQLLERCLMHALFKDRRKTVKQLPNKVVKPVMNKMRQIDPQAEIILDLGCPACHHQWQKHFDILTFFWTEINAWAQRILREVHILASMYGWREADILAMSPMRRQCYLQMVSG